MKPHQYALLAALTILLAVPTTSPLAGQTSPAGGRSSEFKAFAVRAPQFTIVQ
jgi:hypothetical protein